MKRSLASILFAVVVSSVITPCSGVAKQKNTEQEKDWHNIHPVKISGTELVIPVGHAYRSGMIEPHINFDFDNDGMFESLMLLELPDNKWGIEFIKSNGSFAIGDKFQSENFSDKKVSDMTYQISLHDFNSDDIPEIVIEVSPISDLNESLVYVFRINGRGIKITEDNHNQLSRLKNWFENIEVFGSAYGEWHTGKDTIYIDLPSGEFQQYIFRNDKFYYLDPNQ